MKMKLLLALFCGILLLGLMGCNERDLFENDLVETNEECCKGCLCGDTIELLKTTETAWTLTKINLNGDYVYDRHSFINFHGTGKNKFAFFKNNVNASPVSEVRGEMTINEQNEIILIPSDNKTNKITCKVGEEKNLIAIIHCDNNFGTFTLQKQGTLELPNVIKDILSKTKKIVIKTYDNETITITDENDVSIFLSVIDNSKVWTGAVTTPSPLYKMNLFDSNSKRIAEILYNPGNYFNIKINNKSYELTNIDKSLLNTILSK